MRYDTILFDFDDTLIDTLYNTQETLREIYEDYALGRYYPSFDYFFLQVFKPANLGLWKQYEHGEIKKSSLMDERFHRVFADIDEIDNAQTVRINGDYIGRIMRKKKVIPGAIDLLEYLKPKYKLVLLSNGFSEMQYTKIENNGMSDYFDAVILSDQVGVNKPHPDIFRFALNEVHTTPDRAIMVGDNYDTDITGAYNSGVDQLWYNPAQTEKKSFSPTHTVANLLEIRGIL